MRFYVCPDLISPDKNKIEIKDRLEVHHIRDVMRLKMGDAVSVFDGLGREFLCSIERFKKDTVIMKILEELPVRRDTSLNITLYQAIPRKAKMDFIVEKAVELGVAKIAPILTDRTVPDTHDFSNKAERWKRIIMASSRQCGRTKLPIISDIMNFNKALIEVKGKDLVIFAVLDKEAKPLKAVLRDLMPIDETLKGEFQSRNPAFRLFPKNIAVFVGPEGDFSPREVSMAKEIGCSMCSLGSLVLRSETAAIYILSCLSYEFQ